MVLVIEDLHGHPMRDYQRRRHPLGKLDRYQRAVPAHSSVGAVGIGRERGGIEPNR